MYKMIYIYGDSDTNFKNIKLPIGRDNKIINFNSL
jgi:hypothetical protein